jgi:uncharacterized protein YciI
MENYVYKLKLKEEYMDLSKWTEKEEQIVTDHFLRLKKFTEKGKVILAGRTPDETDPEGFGIVIFEAENKKEAQQFMNNDPAISKGIMEGQLFPFRLALIRKTK